MSQFGLSIVLVSIVLAIAISEVLATLLIAFIVLDDRAWRRRAGRIPG